MTQEQQNIRLDVRSLPPRERHTTIFATFEQLAPGQAIDLINDHDPKPLYYQFAAEHPDTFSWTYRQQGPEVWEVEIRKVEAEA
jgi:uncharacterized protein (DUF2249 family)